MGLIGFRGVLSLSEGGLSLLVVAPTERGRLEKLILQFLKGNLSEWFGKDVGDVLSGGDIGKIKVSSG